VAGEWRPPFHSNRNWKLHSPRDQRKPRTASQIAEASYALCPDLESIQFLYDPRSSQVGGLDVGIDVGTMKHLIRRSPT
jgi:hypothetical protein